MSNFNKLAHPAGALQVRVFPYNPAPPGAPLFPTFDTNLMVAMATKSVTMETELLNYVPK